MQGLIKHIFEEWERPGNFFQFVIAEKPLRDKLCQIAEIKFTDAIFLAMSVFKNRTDDMDSNNDEYNYPEMLLFDLLRL